MTYNKQLLLLILSRRDYTSIEFEGGGRNKSLCTKIKTLLVFVSYILTISNSFGLTLSCSYLDTFNSENILTFFFKKDQDRYKYFYKGQERFSYMPLVDDEKKLVLGIFDDDFDGMYIFDKNTRSFKMITIPFKRGKQEKIINGKCEEIL